MKLKSVALLLGQHSGYSRGILRGIARYAGQNRPWTFDVIEAYLDSFLIGGALPIADGYIAQPHANGALIDRLLQTGKPAVLVSDRSEHDLLFSRVGVDDIAVGYMAAKHFLERGYRRFAFVGPRGNGYVDDRLQGLRRGVGELDLPVWIDGVKTEPGDALTSESVLKLDWVARLPNPIAVLAATDSLARQLSEILHTLKIRVPDSVALLGVDNDDVMCELATPSLSSIAAPLEQIGHEAMRLMESLFEGAKPLKKPKLLLPIEVVSRQSTDVWAFNDSEVADAVRYIREHAGISFSLKQLFARSTINRRSMERRFQRALGHSPMAEVRRVHLELAKKLLISTDLPAPVVAKRAGLSGAVRLAELFRRELGITPMAYRRQFRNL